MLIKKETLHNSIMCYERTVSILPITKPLFKYPLYKAYSSVASLSLSYFYIKSKELDRKYNKIIKGDKLSYTILLSYSFYLLLEDKLYPISIISNILHYILQNKIRSLAVKDTSSNLLLNFFQPEVNSNTIPKLFTFYTISPNTCKFYK